MEYWLKINVVPAWSILTLRGILYLFRAEGNVIHDIISIYSQASYSLTKI